MIGYSTRFAILVGLVGSLWLPNAPEAFAGSGAAIIDPAAYASLGVFDPATDVVIDVGSSKMSGGATFTGFNTTVAGAPVLVFDFSSFTLNPGVTLTVAIDTPNASGVALLSRGAMIVGGVINAGGSAGTVGQFGGGPGGGSNGDTNTYGGNGGGGGGYGGNGGNGEEGIPGGGTYNSDLSAQLAEGSFGGSGGASGGGAGGLGGGALQIAAMGNLTVSGTVSVNGGDGAMGQLSNNTAGGSGGGGSGGGILMQGASVTFESNAVVSADGGDGGDAYVLPLGRLNLGGGGGGGGGGRIVVAYFTAVTISGSITVSGGNSGYGISGNGVAGSVEFEQDSMVPALPTLAVSVDPSGNFITTWPAAAANYVLQTSAVLGPGAVWTVVPGAVVIGNNFVLTNQTPGAAGFFRLQIQ